jgi:hypothetical protein
MDYRPITYLWTGEVFKPLASCLREAVNRYVVGQAYTLVEEKQRSRKSHNQQFAWVSEAWEHLPEWFKHEPWAQSPESLRKYALIRTHFCTTSQVVCDSHAEALRWTAFMREQVDEYVLAQVHDTVVNVYRAESQKVAVMGASRFQQSKQAIFDYIARELIGVDPEAFAREVGFKRMASPPLAPEQTTETEQEKVRD